MDAEKVAMLMDDRKMYREFIVCTAKDIANAAQNLSAGSLDELIVSLSKNNEELVTIESELQKITGLLPCNFNQLLKKGGEADENS